MIFFHQISDIKRIHQRIKILLFKSQYKELLEEAEKVKIRGTIVLRERESILLLFKDLVAGRQACETVRRSKRFPKLIELVLTIGNYMNCSTKTYEPIYGFDISFLPKVKTNIELRNLISYSHENSYIPRKLMIANVHYYTLFFKKSKKIMRISCNSVMNFKVLLKWHREVTVSLRME